MAISAIAWAGRRPIASLVDGSLASTGVGVPGTGICWLRRLCCPRSSCCAGLSPVSGRLGPRFGWLVDAEGGRRR